MRKVLIILLVTILTVFIVERLIEEKTINPFSVFDTKAVSQSLSISVTITNTLFSNFIHAKEET